MVHGRRVRDKGALAALHLHLLLGLLLLLIRRTLLLLLLRIRVRLLRLSLSLRLRLSLLLLLLSMLLLSHLRLLLLEHRHLLRLLHRQRALTRAVHALRRRILVRVRRDEGGPLGGLLGLRRVPLLLGEVLVVRLGVLVRPRRAPLRRRREATVALLFRLGRVRERRFG